MPDRVIDTLVVTSFLNRREVLERTVKSLDKAAQRHGAMRVVVVDDKSNPPLDFSPYQDLYPHITFQANPENKGVAATFRDVIADGIRDQPGIRYVGVFGSGDTCHPDKFLLQTRMLDNRPGVMVAGTFYNDVVEGGSSQRHFLRQIHTDRLYYGNLVPGAVFTQGTVLYRREAYEAVGGYRGEFVNGQDYDLWYRIAHHFGKGAFATVPRVLYNRFCRADDGVSFNPDKAILQQRFIALAKKMVLMPEDKQTSVLALLRDRKNLATTLEKLIPLDSPTLQFGVLAYARDAWQIGMHEQATRFLKEHSVRPDFGAAGANVKERARHHMAIGKLPKELEVIVCRR